MNALNHLIGGERQQNAWLWLQDRAIVTRTDRKVLPFWEGRLEDAVQPVLSPRLMFLRPRFAIRHSNRAHGLTLLELAWIGVLGAVMAWVILGTLDNELGEADERLAEDMLDHLAGVITYTLEDGLEEWPTFPLAGPGELPRGLLQAPTGELALLLPEGAFLTPDPWDNAYVLIARRETDDGVHLALQSGGPDGILGDPSDPDERYSVPLGAPK